MQKEKANSPKKPLPRAPWALLSPSNNGLSDLCELGITTL